MATGDAADITTRLQRLLPARWFSTPAPNRDAILGGVADALAWAYSTIVWAKAQTRLLTSAYPMLDVWAYDYLGLSIVRRTNEPDAAFATRVKKEVLRERVTRNGMLQALLDLTGLAPVIIEPWNPGDCGAWSSTTTGQSFNRWGWTVGNSNPSISLTLATQWANGNTAFWGTMALPNETLIGYWPPGVVGVPSVGGWGQGVGSAGTQYGFGWATGVGSGATVSGVSEWVSMAMMSGPVTTQDILNTIVATKPSGVIVWQQAA